jgi:AAHS family 4-hydroxybenzoate transporter-like MFS transporter
MTPTRADLVAKFVDSRPVSRYQYGVIALCGLVMLLDGFDTQVISYAAPFISKEWGLSRQILGSVFSSALMGLMVGYLVISPLADRVGHRRMIIWASIGIGLFTLATGFVQNVTELLVLRFLTGLVLGSVVPSAITLTGEYSPKRLRATFVLAIYVGFSLGFVAAGLASAWLIPMFGWRALFWVGAAGPLLLAPVLYFFLPESVALMIRNRASADRVLAMLRRIDPNVSADAVPSGHDANAGSQAARAPIKEIFSRELIVGTLLLWIVFAVNLGEFYALQNWLPTILQSQGYALNVMVTVTTLTTIGGIVAAFVVGPAMDRLSAYGAVGVLYVMGCGFLIALGFTMHAPLWALFTISFFVGLCVSGGQKSVIALAAIFYPASVRGTGLGWALGVGRVGGIAGPWIIGAVMDPSWPPAVIFSAMAVPMLVIGALIFFLGRLYGAKRASPGLHADPERA